MSWFRSEPKPATVDDLYNAYAAVLEAGPKLGGTVHSLDELPAEKDLIKAVLLAKAYEFGPQADETLKAGYVILANFQAEAAEPAEKHFEIAGEMTTLAEEWVRRVVYGKDDINA